MDRFKLVVSILVCQMVGVLGALFTKGSWYDSLLKPVFNPPSWLFGPVWITLYLLMGISLYLVWVQRPPRKAYAIFSMQLLLNFLWTPLFFGLHESTGITLVLALIMALFILIIATMTVFYPISKRAMYLLIPYALWVGFASLLNLSIAILNG